MIIRIRPFSTNTAPIIKYEGTGTSSVDVSAIERNLTSLTFEVTDNNIGDNLTLGNPVLETGSGELSAVMENGNIFMDYTPAILSKGMHKVVLNVCDDGLPVLCASVTVNIDVIEEGIYPYEAISPNADNLNDFWIIRGIEHYPDNVVVIFDRWNNRVFQVEGYNNSSVVWSGESNKGLTKEELKDGTYYYKITLGQGAGTLSGMVILKR